MRSFPLPPSPPLYRTSNFFQYPPTLRSSLLSQVTVLQHLSDCYVKMPVELLRPVSSTTTVPYGSWILCARYMYIQYMHIHMDIHLHSMLAIHVHVHMYIGRRERQPGLTGHTYMYSICTACACHMYMYMCIQYTYMYM